MSENENIGDISSEDLGIASGELNQNDNHTQDVGDDEENVEDETANPDEEQDDDDLDEEHVPTIREANMAISGVLTLHYEVRDVSLVVDGDAALRVIAMFHAQSDEDWQDHLDPRWSSAASGWLALDLAEPLAMSYSPFARQRGRTTIDPH